MSKHQQLSASSADPRIEEIEARLAKATPGPWWWWSSGRKGGLRSDGVDNRDRDTSVLFVARGNICGSDQDLDLIAHAPSDIAWLISELLRSREEAIEEAAKVCDNEKEAAEDFVRRLPRGLNSAHEFARLNRRAETCRFLADAIRALKSPPPKEKKQ